MRVNASKPASREQLFVFALLGLGALARLIWVSTGNRIKTVINESHNIAVSIAHTGNFADVFVIGGGPSAHVGMLTPLPSAAAYWLFGVDTRLAEYALVLWDIVVVSGGFWLCWRLACTIGAPRGARIAAVVFVALMPLQFSLEVREGAGWEVNLAVLLLTWVLLRLALAGSKDSIDGPDLAAIGLLTGFLFIVSPPAGLAAVLATGLFHLLRVSLRQWWIAPASFVLVAGLLAGAWAERNMIRLGEAIPLRDNFGLELDLSNYSGMVAPADQHDEYMGRLRAIHPMAIGSGAAAMRAAGGEVAYYHKLGRDAQSWIGSHPSDFIKMSARRFVQFFLPPKWFWGMFGGEGKVIWLRRALVWAATIGGFCTLGAMIWRRDAYAYILIAILACSAPYILVQPTLRYRYLVSSLLIFLAFDGAIRLVNYLRSRVEPVTAQNAGRS